LIKSVRVLKLRNPNEYNRERLKDLTKLNHIHRDLQNGLFTVVCIIYNLELMVIFSKLSSTTAKGATFIINEVSLVMF
jgi:hypothetical protein